jgi:hypothetical protein
MNRNHIRELYDKQITIDEYYNLTFVDSVVMIANTKLCYCPFGSRSTIAGELLKYPGYELMIASVLDNVGLVYDLGAINNLTVLRETHRLAIINKHYMFYSLFAIALRRK